MHALTLPRISIFTSRPKAPRACWLWWSAHVLLVTFGLYHHAIWADEADPWNLARTATWSEFWLFFNHSGHPPLWHMLLWPFAHFGAPVPVFLAIHGIIACCVSWQLLFRSPFALWLCVLLIFSQCLGFQYAVIARGYALMTLLAIFLARAHATRMQSPLRYAFLLALLFNSETLIIVPTAILAIWFTLETLHPAHFNKHYLLAISIAATGALASLLLLLPSPDMAPFYTDHHYYAGRFFTNLTAGLWSLASNPINAIITTLFGSKQIPLYLAVLFLLCTTLYIRNTRWLIFYAAWLAWLYYVFTYLYLGFYWHGELILIFSIWTLWLRHDNETPKAPDNISQASIAITLAPILAFGILSCAYSHHENATQQYSGSKDMAHYIASHIENTQTITSLSCYEGVSVAAYLPQTPFWLNSQHIFSHYNHQGVQIHCMQYENNRFTPELETQNQTQDLQILATAEVAFPKNITTELLHVSEGVRETFYLYHLPKAEKSNRNSALQTKE